MASRHVDSPKRKPVRRRTRRWMRVAASSGSSQVPCVVSSSSTGGEKSCASRGRRPVGGHGVSSSSSSAMTVSASRERAPQLVWPFIVADDGRDGGERAADGARADGGRADGGSEERHEVRLDEPVDDGQLPPRRFGEPGSGELGGVVVGCALIALCKSSAGGRGGAILTSVGSGRAVERRRLCARSATVAERRRASSSRCMCAIARRQRCIHTDDGCSPCASSM